MNRLFALLNWFMIGCAFAENVHAQSNPNGRFPVATMDDPFLFLIRDPVVHAELNLTSQQKKALTALNNQLGMPLWSMRNKGGEHIAKTVREVKETTIARLPEILTSAQLRRLSQIEYRTLGMKAFRREEVADRLSLSDARHKKILGILSETSAAITKLTKECDSGTSLESIKKKVRELKIDEQKQILAHYVDHHDVRLPDRLVAHIVANKYTPPSKVSVEIDELPWQPFGVPKLFRIVGQVVGQRLLSLINAPIAAEIIDPLGARQGRTKQQERTDQRNHQTLHRALPWGTF